MPLKHEKGGKVPIIKCDYCGSKKEFDNYLGCYAYHKRLKKGGKVYFCSWACMQKALRENPNKYYEGKYNEVNFTR